MSEVGTEKLKILVHFLATFLEFSLSQHLKTGKAPHLLIGVFFLYLSPLTFTATYSYLLTRISTMSHLEVGIVKLKGLVCKCLYSKAPPFYRLYSTFSTIKTIQQTGSISELGTFTLFASTRSTPDYHC